MEKWEVLLEKIKQSQAENNFPSLEFFNYCINRWYNFQSAKAVEQIFVSLNSVNRYTPATHHSIDFQIGSIRFDHKTSVFPAAFPGNLESAVNNPEKLISWLYQNQSSQNRFHQANRLYVVVFSKSGEHWKLKSEILWLKGLLVEYVLNFEPSQLKTVTFPEGNSAVSDIIWAIK